MLRGSLLALTAIILTSGPASARAYEIHGTLTTEPERAYVLVREGTESVSGAGDMHDYDAARALRHTMHGDFLWFRVGEERWVTQDRELLGRTLDAMKPVEELGRRQAEVGRKQAEIGSMQAKVGSVQGRIGAEQGRLAARQAAAARSGRDEDISARQDELGAQMEAAGRQMERLTKLMEPFSRQQEALGEQQSRASKHLEQVMDDVLHDALERHLAQRLPN